MCIKTPLWKENFKIMPIYQNDDNSILQIKKEQTSETDLDQY